MKQLLILAVSLLLFSCQEDHNTKTPEQLRQDFTLKSVEVLEDLGKYYPIEELGFKISNDQDGKFYTLYKLKGVSEELVHFMSSSTNLIKKSDGGGTSCSGGESCARLLYTCLSGGENAVMTGGNCNGDGDGFCVTCAPQYQ